MAKSGIPFRRHRQRDRQRGAAAHVRFSSPPLRKPRQSECSNSEPASGNPGTATRSSGSLFSSSGATTNVSVPPSRNLGYSVRKHPQTSGIPKSNTATTAGGDHDPFLLSPCPHVLSPPSHKLNPQSRSLSYQNNCNTSASFYSLIPRASSVHPAISTPRSQNLFWMDFVSTYFSRTPRNDANKATTPENRNQNPPTSTGSRFWENEKEERQKTLECCGGVDDAQGMDESSPTTVLCQKLRNIRKSDAWKFTGSLSETGPGFGVPARAGGVHFLAPITDDVDSLQTITLTPKAPTCHPPTPSFSTHPVVPDGPASKNKGFIVRRTSCESATSFETKKDKGFNLFGFWNVRQDSPP